MTDFKMTSSRPYLIRALYQWMVDNGATPHLLVDTLKDNVQVPTEFIENNKIVLNVGPMAARGLQLGNEEITFSARFSGKAMSVIVPIEAVLAIYARENGEGMVFNDPVGNKSVALPSESSKSKKSKKPTLKIVK